MKKLTENFKDALKIKDLSFELARKLNFKKSLGCISSILLLVLIGCQATQTFAQTCSTAPANLVSWYQGENNTIDFISTNNGAIQGNVTYTTGFVGQTFALGGTGNTSGSGDRVLVGNPANLQLQDFTIEAWIKRSSNTIVTNSPVGGFEGGSFFAYGAGGYGFIIQQSTNRIGLTKIGTSAVYSNLTVSDTNFHHVAVTKSGNQVTFYLDGVADAPITYNTTFTFGTNAAIGARGDNDARNAFFGSIDELSIYSRALTASEIQAIVTAGSAGKCLMMVNTFTVTNTNDSGAGSLRQAILDANAATGVDAINFDAGVFSTPQTITLTGGELLITNSSNSTVIITGPGANLLTVSGNNASRIFMILDTPVVSISGMTLTGGNGVGSVQNDAGGAIYNQGNLTLTNMLFTGNTTTGFGGGVVNVNDALTVVNSTFSNNTAGNQGGGISFNGSQSLTITNSTFSNNSAAREGGGLFASGFGVSAANPMTISGSTFSNNSITGPSPTGGGGIGFFNLTASITNSTISGNTDAGNGGGIRNFRATITIASSTITNNSTQNSGGGIILFDSGGATITNSTISNNTANSNNDTNGDGGGVYGDNNTTANISNSTISGNQALGFAAAAGNGGGIFLDGSLTLTNSTISGNSAVRDCGGFLDRVGGTVTVSYTTIVNNAAGRNGGGYCNLDTANSFRGVIIANNTAGAAGPNGGGTINSLGYNLIEDTTGFTITGTTTSNITGVDPMLNVLANYGGPTNTHQLMAGSPAIDAGDTANFPATDQRGVMRPVDGNTGNLVPQPDIGAFEASFVPTAANVTVAGIVSDGFRGIRNAAVILTDPNGVSRIAKTGTFGYFKFENVEAGQTYVVTIISKRYQFTPQIVAVNDHVTDLTFTPEEGSQNTLRAKMPEKKASFLTFPP